MILFVIQVQGDTTVEFINSNYTQNGQNGISIRVSVRGGNHFAYVSTQSVFNLPGEYLDLGISLYRP